MKRFLLSILFLALAASAASAQAPVVELPDPHPADPALWNNVQPAFGWGNIDTKYKIDVVPALDKTVSVYGWKGERVHAQAVLVAPQAVKSFKISVSDLKSGRNTIPAITNFSASPPIRRTSWTSFCSIVFSLAMSPPSKDSLSRVTVVTLVFKTSL